MRARELDFDGPQPFMARIDDNGQDQHLPFPDGVWGDRFLLSTDGSQVWVTNEERTFLCDPSNGQLVQTLPLGFDTFEDCWWNPAGTAGELPVVLFPIKNFG